MCASSPSRLPATPRHPCHPCEPWGLVWGNSWPQNPPDTAHTLCPLVSWHAPRLPKAQAPAPHSGATLCDSCAAAPKYVGKTVGHPPRPLAPKRNPPAGKCTQPISDRDPRANKLPALNSCFPRLVAVVVSCPGQVKARPSVLWCYKKELGFTTFVPYIANPLPDPIALPLAVVHIFWLQNSTQAQTLSTRSTPSHRRTGPSVVPIPCRIPQTP